MRAGAWWSRGGDVVAVALLLCTLALPRLGQSSTSIPGVCPPAAPATPDAGPWPPDASVGPVRVVLAVRDRPGLDALVAAQQDPRSPEFRQWRSGAELAEQFGASPADYQRVRAWLGRRGFRIVRDSALRLAVTIVGTTAQFDAAFRAPLRAVARAGEVLRTPRSEPHLPPHLRASVATIIGLDQLTTPRPVAQLPSGGFALGPADFAVAYEVTSLLASGRTGAGVTIGIAARSDFRIDDVTDFRTRFLPGAAGVVRKRFPSGNPGILASRGNIEESEVLLDTQWAGAMAAGATVEAVIGGRTGGITEALEELVERNQADIFSISFALCEPDTPAGYAAWLDALYAFANAQGQTVVVAAGDDGDRDCPGKSGRAVNALAASPHAIAVGGTAISLDTDAAGNATALAAEQAWNDVTGAGGGGISTLFGLPPFQKAAGLTGEGRLLPDLALAASPVTPGYAFVRGRLLRSIGGTSASAPALAGLLALAVEGQGRRLGQALPAIYRLAGPASNPEPGPIFRDITTGSNGYPATPGFDLATGWGSPRGAAFADGLAQTRSGPCEPLLDCLIPGTGPAQQQCGIEWRVELATPARGKASGGYPTGAPRRQQACRDGDPGCDRDGVADGACAFAVGLCLNVNDPRSSRSRRRPACAARRVTAVTVGGAPETPVALVDAVARLDLPTTMRTACSEVATVRVPVGGRATALRARAQRAGGTVRARLRLSCTQ
jgi:Pro-kumamolisin, activation domain/Subtilase family